MKPSSDIKVGVSIENNRLKSILNNSLQSILGVQTKLKAGGLSIELEGVELSDLKIEKYAVSTSMILDLNNLKFAGVLNLNKKIKVKATFVTRFDIDENMEIDAYTEAEQIEVLRSTFDKQEYKIVSRKNLIHKVLNNNKHVVEKYINQLIDQKLKLDKVSLHDLLHDKLQISGNKHTTSINFQLQEVGLSSTQQKGDFTDLQLLVKCLPEIQIQKEDKEKPDFSNFTVELDKDEDIVSNSIIHPTIKIELSYLEDIIISRMKNLAIPVLGTVSISNMRLKHEKDLVLSEIILNGALRGQVFTRGRIVLDGKNEFLYFKLDDISFGKGLEAPKLLLFGFESMLKKYIESRSRITFHEIQELINNEINKLKTNLQEDRGVTLQVHVRDLTVNQMQLHNEMLIIHPTIDTHLEVHLHTEEIEQLM